MDWADRDKIEGLSIGRGLFVLGLPAVASNLFTMTFEFIDMWWVGRLGPVSIAAMGGASFFVWMLQGLGIIVATGAIALVSRRTGEKNESGLYQTIFYAVGTCFVFALLVMVVFFPLGLYGFDWLGLEPGVATRAMDYSVIYLGGTIFVFFMLTLQFIIRGIGDARTPMIIIGVALFLNVLLDPLFMFGFGMGIRGAAVATILSQAIGSFMMAVVLFRKVPGLRRLKFRVYDFGKREFRRQFRRIMSIGAPIGLSDAGFCFIYLLLAGIVSVYGAAPLAALGIAHRYEALPFFICLGMAMALEPIVGQALGTGDKQRARASGYLALKVTTLLSIGISTVFYFAAPGMMRLFTADAGVIQHGVSYLRILTFFNIFLAAEVVLPGVFSGAGDTKPPFWIVFPITLARVPFCYLAAVVWKWESWTLWLIIGITTFLKGVLLTWQFARGRWMEKKI